MHPSPSAVPDLCIMRFFTCSAPPSTGHPRTWLWRCAHARSLHPRACSMGWQSRGLSLIEFGAFSSEGALPCPAGCPSGFRASWAQMLS